MALHMNKKSVNDDVFDTKTAMSPLPKSHLPEKESEAKSVFHLIKDELLLDGNSRQNLATFCQTYIDEEVHDLMDICIDKNMIDKDEYPQTAEIENRCVKIIANMWNAKSDAAIGTSTTGSSEACMLGGMAMKWRWEKMRKAKGLSTSNPNLICGPVQVCWHKFARYWGVELREIPMDGTRYVANADEVLKRCDENTIGVVLTLGITFTGQFEPVKEVAEALDHLQKKTGLDISIHVDGASGGFLAPFCAPNLLWDFRIPRVKSISTSGHKFGLAPLGCGWIVWGDKKDLPEELIFNVNYLGGNLPTFAINFSRPGGQIIAQYYNLIRFGKEGYYKIQQGCYDVAKYFAQGLEKFGIFDFVYFPNPEAGIPCVTWKLKDSVQNQYNLYQLSDILRERGWLVPAYSLPSHCENQIVQRVLVKRGCTCDLMELLLEDITRALDKAKKMPASKDAASEGSFNHGR